MRCPSIRPFYDLGSTPQPIGAGQVRCALPPGHTGLHAAGAHTWADNTRHALPLAVAHAKVGVAQLPWWRRYDPALIVLVALFISYELVAKFHYHNAAGWHTFSHDVVAFQRRYGWPARCGVYGALTVLAIHFWGGVF